MKTNSKSVVVAVAVVSLCAVAHAGFFDQLKSSLLATNSTATNAPIVVTTNPPALTGPNVAPANAVQTNVAPKTNLLSGLFPKLATNTSASALSQEQMVGGLKEALGKGVSNAVVSLGHEGGFLTNLNVKIPMPEKLQKVESVLRMAGQNQMVDEFVGSMNHAAEKAVPVAAGVFGDSIKQMSITDAKGLLAGGNNSATQFFRRTTQTNLQAKFYPLVQKATDSVGVTARYKAMMGKFTALNTVGTLFGKSSPASLNAADIDSYVTDKAMDGLFKMVAEEEKSIRANPVARTTDLLQKVFGSAMK